MRDPATRPPPSTTFRPKMWNNGMTPSATSSGPRRRPSEACTCSRLATRLPWVSIAARGAPAVPLVNMSTARSAASRSTVSAGAWADQVGQVVAHDDVLEDRQRRPVQVRHDRRALGAADHGSGADGGQLPGQFRHRAPGIERDGHEAAPGRSQPGQHELDGVARHETHPVADVEAQLGQSPLQAGDLSAQLAVGHRPVAHDQGHGIIGMAVDDARHVHRVSLPRPAPSRRPVPPPMGRRGSDRIPSAAPRPR